MSVTIKGTIELIRDEEVISEKFKKREIVITTKENPDYPQHVPMQVVNDKCSLFDGFTVGQEVEVETNIRGKKWVSPKGETKYFATIEIWKMKLAEGVDASPVSVSQPQQDDLPF